MVKKRAVKKKSSINSFSSLRSKKRAVKKTRLSVSKLKKKSSVKRQYSGKTKESIKKEFDEFAGKVAKLELLRKELNAMNTKGFETEAGLIRAKLHDINSIPQIEKEIKSLRESIRRRAARQAVKSDIARQILKKSGSLEQDHESMKKKITELEQRIVKARRPVSKELSKEEVRDVKLIPKLEKELGLLRKDFHEHAKKSNIKIDTSVGTLVDTNFNEFINSIKSELSDKLEAKKTAMESQFETEMDENEKILANRYKELVKEFYDRYKEKVQNELKNDVKRNFNDKLQEELNKERKKLIESLVKENAVKLHSEKRNLIEDLEDDYSKKEQVMIKRIREKEKDLNKRIEQEKKIKEDLNKQFNIKVSGMKDNMQVQLRKNIEDIQKKGDEELKINLGKKEEELGKKFEAEYQEKLKKEIKIREAQIEKKKMEIEQKIVEHARKMFG